MRIDPKAAIAGVPALQVRDALRRLSFYENFDSSALASELRVSPNDADSVISELLRKGYIEPAEGSSDREQRYRATKSGRRLALASGTKPISRKVAATKLAELLQRVETVNGNPEYISRITKVCVFGSFLTAARELSDVDIAYASERRYFGEEYRKQAEKRIDIATANGRRFGTMMDRLGWPDTEILRLLKDRSRGLSLHLDSELVQLDCPFKELFPTNQMADDPDLKAAILDVAKTRSGSRS